ncbi:EscU/YscU/HrcU family type III secretion system export apparatus switch protein [Paralimibaculum aggregatum]|uniref:EscU/YscU/HrcU family type III secretion system export apparatus switch protein n=1 Tax=Paralimibaculum aggregatum TaxID=3036245 RepID=A0ABQ6LME3_9RHOB|nr:flagellar type III secretion system protein FlhB [Limibaculum sp. NKW23]GMG83621.1 EscU/YscU/HrcU family type III secretion system export apparatus switch protein [Limibaculum sp. NKW23]
MAEGDTEAQEKTHDATPRRLEKAWEQGDIPRSQDSQTLAAYAGLALALLLGGGWSAVTLGAALTPVLAMPDALAADLLGEGRGALLPAILGRVLLAAAPAVLLPALLIVMLLVAQRGITVAPEKIAPKLSRISPLANAKQKYGPTGLVDFAKNVVKVGAVATILYLSLAAAMPEIVATPALEARAIGGVLHDRLAEILTGLLVATAAIAFVDLIWQRLEFLRRNRMSHQELKEESKSTEGDPHLRAARRSRAREIATQKMMLDVPRADVVIANPTHYAVALSWDRAPGSAPKCLAKGVDEIALRIRELAEEAGVPVQHDPPTARSIHALVEVGQEVRPEHYRAVAAAVLFAEKLRAEARAKRR